MRGRGERKERGVAVKGALPRNCLYQKLKNLSSMKMYISSPRELRGELLEQLTHVRVYKKQSAERVKTD